MTTFTDSNTKIRVDFSISVNASLSRTLNIKPHPAYYIIHIDTLTVHPAFISHLMVHIYTSYAYISLPTQQTHYFTETEHITYAHLTLHSIHTHTIPNTTIHWTYRAHANIHLPHLPRYTVHTYTLASAHPSAEIVRHHTPHQAHTESSDSLCLYWYVL